MIKKLGLLSIVAAILAFAAPSFASAATGLTEGGKLVPTGKTITFTNSTSFVISSSKFGNITCAPGLVMIDGLLATNSSAEVKAGEGAKTYNATCTAPGGGSVPFTNFRLNSLRTTGGGSGTYSLSFELPLGPEAICKYSSTGSFTYSPSLTTEGSNTITITKQPATITPPACGSSAVIDGSFKLATGGTTTPVFLM